MRRESSGVVVPGATTTDFHRFPVELHHHILCFADPEGILALRKTSRYFLALTQESHLWTAVYNRMRNTHPLSYPQNEFSALASWQSERLLVRASKTEKLFRTLRGNIQHRIIPNGETHKTGPLAALYFLSERFILSVDDTTTVYVWDISKLASSAEAPSFPCARLTLIGWRFIAYSMSTDHSTLYVVISTTTRAHIFSLSLPLNVSDTDEAELSFRDLTYFDARFNKITGIDADSCLVLLELSDTVLEVVDWRTDSRSTIALRQDTTGALRWNHILAIRICGPYILCFRFCSVDAYPIPGQFLKPELVTEQPLPVVQYVLLGMWFSSKISLSRVRYSHSPSGDVYSICALAEDRHYGTFHYVVHLRTTPEPQLSLRLLSSDSALTDRRVSARDLGTSGLRGAWVLKPNSSGDRRVVAFTVQPSLCPFEPSDALVERSQRFDEFVVWIVSSRNADDDVTKCAVSEFTGRIALGSRTGVITLL